MKTSWVASVVVPARGGVAVREDRGEERASCKADGASVEVDGESVGGREELRGLVRSDRVMGGSLASAEACHPW